MNYYEYIEKASNARLAEMVETVKEDNIAFFTVDEIEVLEEAARRLRIPTHKQYEQ